MSLAQMLHRIELRVGSADPTVLNLTPGEVLGPIDVGTEGQWRVTAHGVTESHAYLFFDGKRLFLQSADAAAPVLANGRALPREWVAVEPPCEIAIGGALLWFGAQFDASGPKGPAGHPGTVRRPHPGVGLTGPDIDEVSWDVDDEDSDIDPLSDMTNVVPVDRFMALTSATRRAALAQLLNLPNPGSGPGALPPPAPIPPPSGPGRPQLDLPEPGKSQPGLHAPSTSTAPMPGGSQPGLGFGFDAPPASSPTPTGPMPGGSQPGLDEPPLAGMSQRELAPSDQQVQLPPFETDQLHVLPSGADPASETARTSPAKQPSRWRSMSFPQKATVILLLPMALSVLVLFTDIVPIPGKTPAATGSSSPAARASGAPSPATAGRSSAAPATARPSSPARSTAGPSTAGPSAAGPSTAGPSAEPSDGHGAPDRAQETPTTEVAGSTPAADSVEDDDLDKGDKTMQRQAVDALVGGSFKEAAELYEVLAKKYPDNKAYAAAAAITRAKAEAKK